MPNWCVGDLKIRGESADITHFLTECIVGCECDIDELGTLEIKNIRGQEFNQELEIIKGVLTLDKCIEFKNYIWECPKPYLGG